MASTERRHDVSDEALSGDERWLLGTVLQKMIEEDFGCPIDDVRAAEIEQWARRHCLDSDGRFVQREFDVLMKVLA